MILVIDANDAFSPLNVFEWLDTDGDGTCNNADNDDDNDIFRWFIRYLSHETEPKARYKMLMAWVI